MSTHDYAASLPELGQLQELLLSTETLDEFLREITIQAAGDPERELSCGVTVYTREGRPYTLSSSDEMANRLDASQYQAGSGPCLHALEQAVPVSLASMADAAQWPAFQRQATVEGLVSSLSVPMSADRSYRHKSVGALNLYARGRRLDEDETRRAHAFAERVAGAVALATRLSEQQRLTEDLQAALVSRTTIDQALGILMSQQRCDADKAFDILRQVSQNRNVKVRDLAADLIAQVSGDEPHPGPPVR